MSHHHPIVAPDKQPEDQQPQWRKDFPIEVAQDDYVARRDFTKFLVLISGGFVTGQVWIGMQNWLRARRGQPPVFRITSLDELAVAGTVTFKYPGPHDDCILVRPTADTLLAYGQKCTHLACPVIPDYEDKCFHCPAHHGVFEMSSGRAIAGPPRRPLSKITLQIRGGDVYATGVELSTV